MHTFLKWRGCTIFKHASWRHYTDVFDVKILESCAKSFYKLKNVKILKHNITGLREVENDIEIFHKNRNRLNEIMILFVSGV